MPRLGKRVSGEGADNESDDAKEAGTAAGQDGRAPPPKPAAGAHTVQPPNEQRRRELLAARQRDEAALAAKRSSGSFRGGSGALGGSAADDDLNRARLRKIEHDKREKQARRDAAEKERKRVEQAKIDSHHKQQRVKAEQLSGGGTPSRVVRETTREHWAARDAAATVCIYIYIYVYMYINIHICYTSIDLCVYIYMYVYMSVFTYCAANDSGALGSAGCSCDGKHT